MARKQETSEQGRGTRKSQSRMSKQESGRDEAAHKSTRSRSKGDSDPRARASSTKGKGSRVNLNTADEEELRHITGLGARRARQIVQYREAHGQFHDLSDLRQVEGFDDKLMEVVRREAEI